jgi:hypothetical protein
MAKLTVCDLCQAQIDKTKGGGTLAWVTQELSKEDSVNFIATGEMPSYLHKLDLCVPCCENIGALVRTTGGLQ